VRDADVAQQMIVKDAQVLALAPSLMHATHRSEPARKKYGC
jgi:hypothetical protein